LLFNGTVAVIVLSARYAGVLLAKVKLADVTKGAYPKFSRSTLKSFKTVAVLKAEFHILNLAIFPFMEQATQLVRASPTQSSAELLEFLV
jgi:hypothetical protein